MVHVPRENGVEKWEWTRRKSLPVAAKTRDKVKGSATARAGNRP